MKLVYRLMMQFQGENLYYRLFTDLKHVFGIDTGLYRLKLN